MGVPLAEHWQLPVEIRQACENHDLDEFGQFTEYGEGAAFVKMICISCLISGLVTYPLSEEKKQNISQGIMQSLDISEERFLELMAEVYDLKVEVDQFTSQMV